ncbi:MAG: hypothetical protein M1829_005243 [Trizodia sp. TS-e1964]|nr:MAG: hypothetical protein M1829_005243 [Trizodia sp. TS-e1964]
MLSEKEQLEDFLQHNPTIKFIRLQWIDFSGAAHISLAQNCMLIPISIAPRIFSLSDYHETWRLQPDWTSLRCCGFRRAHAAAMGFVDQLDAERRRDKCPRHLLVNTLQRLEREWGAQVRIGFEIEFVLLDTANRTIAPMVRLRADTLDIVEEILEIALAPEPALVAVDSLVLAQEAIRTICVRRQLRASMAPKATLAGPANGLHLHLSLDKLAGPAAEHFLADVLGHMGALCAFGMANFDGYARATSDAAGAWIGFGIDNRDLPVRKISELHWEFRMLDATANPYLFVAVLLLAALDGLGAKRELVWRDCKFFLDRLSAEQRRAHGLDARMPALLKEALECLKSDTAVPTWMPADMLKWYISVKDKEVEEFGRMSDEQRRERFLQFF